MPHKHTPRGTQRAATIASQHSTDSVPAATTGTIAADEGHDHDGDHAGAVGHRRKSLRDYDAATVGAKSGADLSAAPRIEAPPAPPLHNDVVPPPPRPVSPTDPASRARLGLPPLAAPGTSVPALGRMPQTQQAQRRSAKPKTPATPDEQEAAGYSQRKKELAAVAALEAQYGLTPPADHPDHEAGLVRFDHLLLLPIYPSVCALAGVDGIFDLAIGPALLRRAGVGNPAPAAVQAVEEEHWDILAQGDLGTWRAHQRGDSWCGRADGAYRRMPKPLGGPKEYVEQCHRLAAEMADRSDAAWREAHPDPHAPDDTLRSTIAALAHRIAADTGEPALEALYRYHLAVIVTRIRWGAPDDAADGSPRRETPEPAALAI